MPGKTKNEATWGTPNTRKQRTSWRWIFSLFRTVAAECVALASLAKIQARTTLVTNIAHENTYASIEHCTKEMAHNAPHTIAGSIMQNLEGHRYLPRRQSLCRKPNHRGKSCSCPSGSNWEVRTVALCNMEREGEISMTKYLGSLEQTDEVFGEAAIYLRREYVNQSQETHLATGAKSVFGKMIFLLK